MSAYSEVQRIAQLLSKLSNDGNILRRHVLKSFEELRSLPVTVHILQSTKVGHIVNKIRKTSTDHKVVDSASELIRVWKKILMQHAAKPANGTAESQSERKRIYPVITIGSSSDEESGKCVTQGSWNKFSSNTRDGNDQLRIKKKVSVDTEGSSMGSNSAEALSEVRLKCRDMLINSLKTGDLSDWHSGADELGSQIEHAIFILHGNTDEKKYMATVRSRVFNLRDKQNGDLRVNVLSGAITAKQLAAMTAEEMASSEMKKLREKYTKDSIEERQVDVDTGYTSDLFKCSRCGGNKCTYSQAQTLCADEPMTTFVWCRQCDNRWRFY